MSSEKASRVKKRGHNKEHLYASLIGGKVVSGIKKEDVIDYNGNYHSVKGGSEMKGGDGIKGKWQVFLYKIARFESDTSFYGRDIFIKILNLYPKTHDEYVKDKDMIRERVKPCMLELKNYLLDSNNKLNFINKSFFNERVKYFVIYHDDIFRVFDKNQLVNILVNTLVVDVNSTSQKVVFTYDDKLVSEIEIRTTDDGKYPSILYNTLKHRVCGIMSDFELERKALTPNVYIYGDAIGTFKLQDGKS